MAIEGKDPNSAEKVMARHIEATRQEVAKIIKGK